MLVTKPDGIQCIIRNIFVLIWPAVNSRMMYLTLHRKFSYELKRHTSGTFINIELMNTLILNLL
jgi:hypothetical protein